LSPDSSGGLLTYGEGFKILITDKAIVADDISSNTFEIRRPWFKPIKLVNQVNGASNANQGETIDIVWGRNFQIKTMKIELHKVDNINTVVSPSTLVKIIEESISVDFGEINGVSTYPWIPDLCGNTLCFGTGFRFNLVDLSGISYDSSPPNYEFSITKPSFTTLVVPNFVNQGSSANIKWEYSLTIAKVQLELCNVDGSFVSQISTNITTSEKAKTWNLVYNDYSGNYKIKIKDLLEVADYKFSNEFQIIPPKPTMVRHVLYNHPVSKYNDYSKINQGQPTTIEWDYSGNIDTVSIILMKGGLDVEVIVSPEQSVIASTKKYVGWIPGYNDISGSGYVIRLFDTTVNNTYNTLTVESSEIEIVGPELTNVLLKGSADINQKINEGNNLPISWTTTGYVEKLNLVLLKKSKLLTTKPTRFGEGTPETAEKAKVFADMLGLPYDNTFSGNYFIKGLFAKDTNGDSIYKAYFGIGGTSEDIKSELNLNSIVKYDANQWTRLENRHTEKYEPNSFAAPDPFITIENRPLPPKANKLMQMVIPVQVFSAKKNGINLTRVNTSDVIMGATDISRVSIRYVSDKVEYKHYINNMQIVIQRMNPELGLSNLIEYIDISDVSGVSSGFLIRKDNGLNYIDLSQNLGTVTNIGIAGYWNDQGPDGSGCYLEVSGKAVDEYNVYRPYYRPVAYGVKNLGYGGWSVPKQFPREQDLCVGIYDSSGILQKINAIGCDFDIGVDETRKSQEYENAKFFAGLQAMKFSGNKATLKVATLSSTNDGARAPSESVAAMAGILAAFQSDGNQETGGDSLTPGRVAEIAKQKVRKEKQNYRFSVASNTHSGSTGRLLKLKALANQ